MMEFHTFSFGFSFASFGLDVAVYSWGEFLSYYEKEDLYCIFQQFCVNNLRIQPKPFKIFIQKYSQRDIKSATNFVSNMQQ